MDEKHDALLHEKLTEKIIGSAFEVINEMGSGFNEKVYENSLVVAASQNGLSVSAQHPIKVMFRGVCVGEFFADVLIEEKVIVELQAVKALLPEHEAQVINYLNATGYEVGLLINFGNPRLEFKRLTRRKDFRQD